MTQIIVISLYLYFVLLLSCRLLTECLPLSLNTYIRRMCAEPSILNFFICLGFFFTITLCLECDLQIAYFSKSHS